MPEHITAFAKIVSPPSSTAWAQTYHAGNVYTVVSVTQLGEQQESPEHALPSVHVIGKEIINNLEAEYFAIAEKNLETIKEALGNTTKEIPNSVDATIIFAVVQSTNLYLFLYGNGAVYIKRDGKFGTLLQQHAGDKKQLVSASGVSEPSDMIIMITDACTKAIPIEELIDQLSHTPAEIAETFSVKLDDETFAGAAAIIFSIPGEKTMTTSLPLPKVEAEKQENKEIQETPEGITSISEPKMDLDDKPDISSEETIQKPNNEQKKKRFIFSPRKIFLLCVILLLAGILVGAIVLTKQKQEDKAAQASFITEFPKAKAQYDEGQNLLSLNNALAQTDFSQAKTTLEDLQSKLQKNSSQAQQVTALLTQVSQSLEQITSGQTASLTPSDSSSSMLLTTEMTDTGDMYFSQQNNTIYTANQSGISTIDGSGKTKQIVENKNDWDTIGGFQIYFDNFYVVDTKSNHIIKFTKSSDTYSKSNYFSSNTPELSRVVSLAIDGSVWILGSDGTIQKFTKGQHDQFAIQNLQMPLNHPSRIFTNINEDNLYILDKGNNRILIVKKNDGTIVSQIASPQLKNARDIDVDEKDKKIFVLINNKIFEIDIK